VKQIILTLVALMACAGAFAQTPDAARIQDEAGRQRRIYESKGADVPAGYVITRGLAAYTSALPPGFEQDLARLSANARWLDIGAGEGQAILDYLNSADAAGKSSAVAMSIEDRRTKQWHDTATRLDAGKILYLHGKSLNDYTLAELGQFQIISDLLGGFSYTRDISRFMEKTLSFLEVNGSFYSILQDVHSEDGSNLPHYRDRGESYLTEILNPDGSKLKMCAWLKHISCVEVTCELKARWTPPVEVYRVRKTCDNVIVPQLTPTRYSAGTPPERRFLTTVENRNDTVDASR
jgi:hypothetical protein